MTRDLFRKYDPNAEYKVRGQLLNDYADALNPIQLSSHGGVGGHGSDTTVAAFVPPPEFLMGYGIVVSTGDDETLFGMKTARNGSFCSLQP